MFSHRYQSTFHTDYYTVECLKATGLARYAFPEPFHSSIIVQNEISTIQSLLAEIACVIFNTRHVNCLIMVLDSLALLTSCHKEIY